MHMCICLTSRIWSMQFTRLSATDSTMAAKAGVHGMDWLSHERMLK